MSCEFNNVNAFEKKIKKVKIVFNISVYIPVKAEQIVFKVDNGCLFKCDSIFLIY